MEKQQVISVLTAPVGGFLVWLLLGWPVRCEPIGNTGLCRNVAVTGGDPISETVCGLIGIGLAVLVYVCWPESWK